jgi:hypothetical protein
MKAILLDIDHTVSDAFWRDHLILTPGMPGDWDDYHAASINDQPLGDMVNMINALAVNYFILGITARPEKWRKLTMEWLLRNDIAIDDLLMRPDDDYRRAPELKVAMAQAAFGDRFLEDVALVLDDREDVIAAFKAAGITALQVHAKKGRTV